MNIGYCLSVGTLNGKKVRRCTTSCVSFYSTCLKTVVKLVSVDDCDPEYLPPAIAFRMGAVTISCVRSPGIFYVQMKKNEEALAGMMNDIAEIVEKLSPYESQLVPGEVVLARVTPSLGKPFYAWEWARVVVTSVNNDESAQVKVV